MGVTRQVGLQFFEKLTESGLQNIVEKLVCPKGGGVVLVLEVEGFFCGGQFLLIQ